MKAAEKESHKVQATAPVKDHPMEQQPDTKPVSALDFQAILDRISALERENADLKASNVKLQEAVQRIETKTQQALDWTLEGRGHPAAREIQEKFQNEREFILEGVATILRRVFGTTLDQRSPDVA